MIVSTTTDTRGDTVTDPDGRTRTFAYNDQGALVAEDWYDASGTLDDALTFTYNAQGLLASASNDAGAYTFTYNSQGQVVYETEPYGQWLRFTYNSSGRVVAVTDSQGGDTTSTYDANGNLIDRQLSAPGDSTLGVAFSESSTGQVTGVIRTDGGSLVGESAIVYDPATGAPTGIVYYDASGNVLDGFAYSYNADGQLASETDAPLGSSPTELANFAASALSTGGAAGSAAALGATTNYAYDADGQLVAAGATSYAYDANGNRIGDVIGQDNRILSDGTWNYSYDADGNRIGKVNIADGDAWVYTYDDANRLTSATETSANGVELAKATFTYDVFGNLIAQNVWNSPTVSPTVQHYAYNGQQLWATLDGNNNLVTRYLDGNGDEV